MNAIEIKQLEKTYSEGKKALDRISLVVPQGTIFGFLGPNGAGKTTTIKLLTGILNPTGGEMSVLNLNPAKEAEKLHQLTGVLTEHAGMYDHLTGIDNLSFFGQLFGMSKSDSEAKGMQLLEKLGLSDAAQVKLKSYSTGMRQRLSLARTLIHSPKLLFLDEPTSGLDPESTKSVNELLLELSKEEGTTIFLCTHQLRYAQEICNEYGLMDNGKLLALGSLEQLRKRTFNSYKLTIETDFMPQTIDSKQISEDTYELSLQEKSEIPVLVKEIVQQGGNISQVTPTDYSLEDIYFALLEGGETYV
ncbi:ABC transporter ATP-binding protein [Enterococcus avium]|uniref:ABC transporter ATP-binding protein n=1 Tax=Enterococcus malodoratus TaxID=71451 RepID=UPI0008B993FF|nr:ABC transporter ATP-binding protein [Enterococcus malodoratus]BBM17918.1 ABC transporter ATP-binding protein [Enterococcus avium]SET37916.1 ABC-2 type transport system ATP-binding protein [Enterococcus malodoratus]